MNICSFQGENDSSRIGFNNNLGSAKWRGLRQTMWPHTNFLPYKPLISLIRILIPSAKQCRSPEQRLCMSSVAFSLNCARQFLWASLVMEQGMFELDGSFFYLSFQQGEKTPHILKTIHPLLDKDSPMLLRPKYSQPINWQILEQSLILSTTPF